ncbi:MAG: DUF262 domain-containing protein [Nitrospirae bacterium]|nr:DUF262 domain-containing protein [Nitrospirota bacterium]
MGNGENGKTLTYDWYEKEDDEYEDDDSSIKQYDITAVPNDFNVRTIFDFIEAGRVKIPGFQRNYVWDLIRASKLIESLIIGLPIPQIFLFERTRNEYLVIDGQQRLMTLYYFIKQRFPQMDKRAHLRTIYVEKGNIPNELLYNEEYFTNFNLALPSKLPNSENIYNNKNYSTLGGENSEFAYRTIRNVVIRQNQPVGDDDSSIYEIFNRLNSGGINLTPQEIRISLYHSNFYDALYKLNINEQWRRLIGLPEPDIHMKDIEFILRGFALLMEGDDYSPSMTRFLNKYSKNCRQLKDSMISYLQSLFDSFMNACEHLSVKAFFGKNNKFNISIYESVFVTICSVHSKKLSLVDNHINPEHLQKLKEDSKFIEASRLKTTSKANVNTRLRRAKEFLINEEESL